MLLRRQIESPLGEERCWAKLKIVGPGSLSERNANGLRNLFCDVQSRAVLVFHLFDRKNLATQACELGKFLLNCLQPFLPLLLSEPGLCSITISSPILFVRPLNVSDLITETPYLFPKNLKVIHSI